LHGCWQLHVTELDKIARSWNSQLHNNSMLKYLLFHNHDVSKKQQRLIIILKKNFKSWGCKLYHPRWPLGTPAPALTIFYVGSGFRQYHLISTSTFPVSLIAKILIFLIWTWSEHQRPHLQYQMTQHLT
jgi:hypothetical protein